jgi:hypothetical protein
LIHFYKSWEASLPHLEVPDTRTLRPKAGTTAQKTAKYYSKKETSPESGHMAEQQERRGQPVHHKKSRQPITRTTAEKETHMLGLGTFLKSPHGTSHTPGVYIFRLCLHTGTCYTIFESSRYYWIFCSGANKSREHARGLNPAR